MRCDTYDAYLLRYLSYKPHLGSVDAVDETPGSYGYVIWRARAAEQLLEYLDAHGREQAHISDLHVFLGTAVHKAMVNCCRVSKHVAANFLRRLKTNAGDLANVMLVQKQSDVTLPVVKGSIRGQQGRLTFGLVDVSN